MKIMICIHLGKGLADLATRIQQPQNALAHAGHRDGPCAAHRLSGQSGAGVPGRCRLGHHPARMRRYPHRLHSRRSIIDFCT